MSHVTADPAAFNDPALDVCLPFLINEGAFRGRFVRLNNAATEILKRHNDPEPVARLLAESMVAAIALAGGLKYDGVFTFQVQGQGPVRTLVTDVTSGGHLRGCVKFDDDELRREFERPHAPGARPLLLGSGGHMAFTVDQGPDTERYQGIVDLAGESISDAVHHYFRQSEQLESALKIAIAPPLEGQDSWRAAGLIIQRMPEGGGVKHFDVEDMEDAWRAAVILLGSLTDAELLSPDLSPLRLLSQLYGTVGVRVTTPKPISAKCRCSKERSERIIASFPVEEVKSFAEDGEVRMTCEFCHESYIFPESQLDAIAAKHRHNQ